jgi:hypothetical protein
MLHVKRLELVSDTPVGARLAATLADDIAQAIHTEWVTSGPQPRLVIDRLSIDASASDLARTSFPHEVAKSTIARIRRRREQE